MPRKVYRKGKSKAGPLKRLQREVKKIERVMQGLETKVSVLPFNGGATERQSNVMQIDNITDISLGSGDGNRIGDSIRVTGIHVRYLGLNNTGDDTSKQMLRFILFQDRKFTGTPASGDELLAGYTETNDRFTNFLSPLSHDRCPDYGDSAQQKRIKPFKIISDHLMKVPYASGNGIDIVYERKFIFKQGLSVLYSGSNAGVGQIFLAVFPGCFSDSANNPQYGWNVKLYYNDI